MPDATTGGQQTAEAGAAPDPGSGPGPVPSAPVPPVPRPRPGRLAGWARRARAAAARHPLFLAVAAAAAVLRAVVMLGYPPVIWFNDSYSYVGDAVGHSASPARPAGYPLFLWVLEHAHSFALVALAQHAMGLAVGVGTYLLLRRRGLPAWAATLAAVPVLFDAYQVQLEQEVMSDTLFLLLVAAVVVLLCWTDRVSVRAAAVAGVLIGYATVVRSVGLPLLVVVAGCLLARRASWRPLAALLAAGVIPVVVYMAGFHTQHKRFAITTSDGVFLYGRVMGFADCATIKPPPSLRPLCDPRPPARRPIAVEYIWSKSDPLWQEAGGTHSYLFTPHVNALARQFAERAILAQPVDYLRAVAADTWRNFGWSRGLAYDHKTDILYVFAAPPPQIPVWGQWPALRAFQPGLTEPAAVQPYARFLHAYQRWIYLRGTLLGLILLAGLAGVAARWRHWGGLVLLPWATALLLLVLPAATSGFSYRYGLAVVPFACLAAGLAAAPRASSTGRREPRDQGDAIRLS